MRTCLTRSKNKNPNYWQDVHTSNPALPSPSLTSPMQSLEPSIHQIAHLHPDLTTCSQLPYLQISLTNDRSSRFMLVLSNQATPWSMSKSSNTIGRQWEVGTRSSHCFLLWSTSVGHTQTSRLPCLPLPPWKSTYRPSKLIAKPNMSRKCLCRNRSGRNISISGSR